MARYAHNIHQVHIADGFSSDCDELIHRCLQLQTLDYKAFCDIWKDLNFGMIYQGRNSGAEIAELSEEVIYIAKTYMVKDTSNFEESVAGLFLVYGLLTLQPFRGFVWLRIVPDDVPCINRIEVVARRERRLDVLYILGEVLVKYTQYHAAERDRGMESVLRKYLEGYTSIDKLGVRPRGVFYRQNEELDIIRDLGTITRKYTRAKTSLIGQGQKDPSLQYINENLPNELNTSLRRIINGMIDDEADDDDDDDDEEPSIDHYDAVQAIKNKAMTNTVNPIKHLTRIEERKTPNTSPKKKSKAATGKVTTYSPNKSTTTSPRKRKTEPKSRKKKAKESPKVENLPELGNITDTVDLNIEEFQKGNVVAPKVTHMEFMNGEELKIQIESLPAVIQTDSNGRLIEIEIIDNAKKDVNTENDQSKKGEEISDKIDEGSTETSSPTKGRSSKRKLKDIPDMEPERKITKQRDFKRTKLKSKFKKMGMLPVANFKEQK